MAQALIPEVHWAQRSNATVEEKNVVFLTIILPDISNESVDLTKDALKFSASSHDDKYAVTINFHDEVVPEQSAYHTTDRGLFMVLRKKNIQEEYWPRLTKEKRLPYVKTDFDKWVEEDEQEEKAEENPMNGMDMSQLQAMAGGAGGGDGAGGGMDLSQLQAMAGAAGGGGDGNMDLSQLQAMAGGAGAGGDGNVDLSALGGGEK